jgi:carbon-monoxide dehydrogenase medium subunit
MGARLRAQAARGERWIDAQDFFRGVFETALRADELLVEIEWPAAAPRTGTCFLEVARRQGDFALLGTAAIITLDANGACTAARLAFCHAAATPVAATRAAQALVGRRIDDGDIEAAGAAVQTEIDPGGSVQASKAFQRHLAGVLTRRALRTALTRAEAAQ